MPRGAHGMTDYCFPTCCSCSHLLSLALALLLLNLPLSMFGLILIMREKGESTVQVAWTRGCELCQWGRGLFSLLEKFGQMLSLGWMAWAIWVPDTWKCCFSQASPAWHSVPGCRGRPHRDPWRLPQKRWLFPRESRIEIEVYRFTGKALFRVVCWNEGSLRSRLCLMPVPRTGPTAVTHKYFLNNLFPVVDPLLGC